MARCPHCTTENDTGAAFCLQCGLAVPSEAPSAPRLVWSEQEARTRLGRELQLDLLAQQSGKAFGALLAVAGGVGADLVLGCCSFSSLDGLPRRTFATALSVDVVSLALFLGLAIWSRFRPYPAAVVGVVVCISMCLSSAAMSPVTMVLALLIKIVAIALLIQVILAGGKCRRMRATAATMGRL